MVCGQQGQLVRVARRRAAARGLVPGDLGPTIDSKDGAVSTHWIVQPGLLLRLGGRVHLDLAFQFTQPFPGKTRATASSASGRTWGSRSRSEYTEHATRRVSL